MYYTVLGFMIRVRVLRFMIRVLRVRTRVKDFLRFMIRTRGFRVTA